MTEGMQEPTTGINSLPSEVLSLILHNLPIKDVISFASTCKSNYEEVFNNQLLWKTQIKEILPSHMFKSVVINGTDCWIQNVKKLYSLKKHVYGEILKMQSKHFLDSENELVAALLARMTSENLHGFVRDARSALNSHRFESTVSLDQVQHFMEIALSDNLNYFYVIFILQDLVRKTEAALKNNCTKMPYTLTEMRYAKYILRYLIHCYLIIKWKKSLDNGHNMSPMDTLNFFVQWLDTTEWHWKEDILNAISELTNKVKMILDVRYPASSTLSIPEKIAKNIVTEKEVLIAVSQMLHTEFEDYSFPPSIDTLDIVKSVKTKRTTSITMAIMFHAVAYRVGVGMLMSTFATHLFVDWRDNDSKSYIVDLKTGELRAKRKCPFAAVDRDIKPGGYSSDALMQYIFHMYRAQMNYTKSWYSHNLLSLADFLIHEYDYAAYKPYHNFMEALSQKSDEIKPPLNIANMHPNHIEVIRHLIYLNTPSGVVKRKIVVKCHHGRVKYAIGMLCQHKVHGYAGIISSWGVNCLKDLETIVKKRELEFGLNQPFYFVVADDQSIRYVAQEHLVEMKAPTRMLHLEDIIAKDFSHFNGFSYVPNHEKRLEYPMDEAIAKVYWNRCAMKPPQ